MNKTMNRKTENRTLEMSRKLSRKLSGASLALVALAALSSAVSTVAVAQTSERASGQTTSYGQGRQPGWVFTIEAQTGGDTLVSATSQDCSSRLVVNGQERANCITSVNRLRAGDGVNWGVGLLLPVENTAIDLEFVGGISHSGLLENDGVYNSGRDTRIAALSRYFIRGGAFINMKSSMRIGFSLTSHIGGKYKIYADGSTARHFDTAIGARFQMDWWTGGDVSVGWYLEEISYDTAGAQGVDGGAAGFITIFTFR